MRGWAIDLGATNTGVAYWDDQSGRPRLLELPGVCRKPGGEDHLEAPKLVPTATHALGEGGSLWDRVGRWRMFERRFFLGRQALIGREALERNEGAVTPNFCASFKRTLGRAPLQTVAREGTRVLSAREVAGRFVRELLAEIKRETGVRLRDVVLTTPVDAYEAYRAELKGIMARFGVKNLRFIDEPVAAAIGYGLGLTRTRRVLVVDFGGSTLDMALVEITARGAQEGMCTVIAKTGRGIGGGLVDRWLLARFCEELGYPLDEMSGGRGAFWYRLMLDEARRVKERIFFKEKALFTLTPPEEYRSFEARLHGEAEARDVSREDVIEVLREKGLYDALDECLSELLEQARVNGVDEGDIEDVLMVGGSTLLPGIYARFEARFGRDRVRAWQPFEAVAYGASAFATEGFETSDFIIHDYAFMTYDLETHAPRYTVIVPGGTRFPTPPDFWQRQLVPTCESGVPETMFKLVICEIGRAESDRRFSWDAAGALHKLGGEQGVDQLVVELNKSNPTLGTLQPPHPPHDREPRLEISFSVSADRWLCARVRDLKTQRDLMKDEPVVRLL